MVAAFAAYLAGLFLLGRGGGLPPEGRDRARRAVQLLPLAGPVLLSTDVYTYWDYARISTEHGGNPYTDVPSDHPDDVAYPLMGSYWHDTTSVYGPGSRSPPRPREHRRRVPDAAAWAYRASPRSRWSRSSSPRDSRQTRLRRCLRRLEPAARRPLRRRGHNDAWMMASCSALALAASGKAWLAGVSWAWRSRSSGFRCSSCPAVPRGERPARWTTGAWRSGAVIVAIATWRYGLVVGRSGWAACDEPRGGPRPVRDAEPGRVARPARGAVALVFALAFVAAYAWLLREAWRGRARSRSPPGSCSSALVARPVVRGVAVPLAAVEEDRTARALAPRLRISSGTRSRSSVYGTPSWKP